MMAAFLWTAMGKHPVANDFFQLGAGDPTVRAVWEWVEIGFNRWISPEKKQPASLSFRWWAAGARKNTILCGILRASTDHIGRPYPLLVAGYGDLKGWRKYWNLLPFACESTWNRMETFAAGCQRDLPGMEQKLLYLPAPAANWRQFQDRLRSRLESDAPALTAATTGFSEGSAPRGLHQHRDGVLRVPVPRLGGGRHARVLSDYYGQWKTRNRELPSIVFMGGPMDAAQLFLFLRPLRTEDFITLWNAGSGPTSD